MDPDRTQDEPRNTRRRVVCAPERGWKRGARRSVRGVDRPLLPIFLFIMFLSMSLISRRSSLVAPRSERFPRHHNTSLICCKHFFRTVVYPSPQLLAPQRFSALDICLRKKRRGRRRPSRIAAVNPYRQTSWRKSAAKPVSSGQEPTLK